jgi:hypothetical protein
MLSMSYELVPNSFFGALEHIMCVFRCYSAASHANVSRNEGKKQKNTQIRMQSSVVRVNLSCKGPLLEQK